MDIVRGAGRSSADPEEAEVEPFNDRLVGLSPDPSKRDFTAGLDALVERLRSSQV